MSENLKFQGVSDVANVPLHLYRVTGFHPKCKTKFWYFYRILCVSAMFLLFSFGIIQIDMSLKTSLNEAVEPLQSTILLFQAWSRGMVLWYQKENLEKLFVGSAKFWRKANQESFQFLKMTKFFNHFYLFWCFWVAFLYSMGPVFGGAKTIFAIYTPPSFNLKVANAIHIFTGCVSFSCLMGGDVVFSSICSEAITQFNMLAVKFQNLEYNSRSVQFDRKLKICIEFHSFLLEYCQTLNKFGAGIFLLQFVITMFASCVQLYIVLQDGFSFVNKMRCFVFFTGQLAEFGIYCVLAEILIETSSKIGKSAYHLNWYQGKYQQSNGKCPKAVSMIIKRSQKEPKFSGYGLVTVDLTAFTQVFKSVLSFYAYMKTATEEE